MNKDFLKQMSLFRMQAVYAHRLVADASFDGKRSMRFKITVQMIWNEVLWKGYEQFMSYLL